MERKKRDMREIIRSILLMDICGGLKDSDIDDDDIDFILSSLNFKENQEIIIKIKFENQAQKLKKAEEKAKLWMKKNLTD